MSRNSDSQHTSLAFLDLEVLRERLRMARTIVLLLLLSCIVGLCYRRFRSDFQPGWTSKRNLPKPNQQLWLPRLLYESTVFELERWSDEIAHHGTIRYFGILNQERIFAVSPWAVRDLLVSDAYIFINARGFLDASLMPASV